MARAVKANVPKPQTLHPRLVRYYDKDWNELEHLRIEEALPREVLDAVENWLFERDLLRLGKVRSSALVDATSMTIGGNNEED